MAGIFDSSIWANLGNTLGNKYRYQQALRKQKEKDRDESIKSGLSTIEKNNANYNKKQASLDYLNGLKAQVEERQRIEDINEGNEIDDSLMLNELPIVQEDKEPELGIDESIWIDREPKDLNFGKPEGFQEAMINGYQPSDIQQEDLDFMDVFNVAKASPADRRIAQAIIGADTDGIWGKESKSKYNLFKREY